MIRRLDLNKVMWRCAKVFVPQEIIHDVFPGQLDVEVVGCIVCLLDDEEVIVDVNFKHCKGLRVAQKAEVDILLGVEVQAVALL